MTYPGFPQLQTFRCVALSDVTDQQQPLALQHKVAECTFRRAPHETLSNAPRNKSDYDGPKRRL